MMAKGSSSSALLGSAAFPRTVFESLDEIFEEFEEEVFIKLDHHQKMMRVNQRLYELIQGYRERQFLLLEVADFFHQIKKREVLQKYSFSDFELWMNQFSHLSMEENLKIRALITGQWIPRDDYQIFFPVGMGKVYEGSHFVTAHQSPDLDTIVASFWGWMDAFSARVASGLHLWNVPGGSPEFSVEVGLLFDQMIGETFIQDFSKHRSELTLTSFDLMTQSGFVKKKGYEHSVLGEQRNQMAIVLVDDDGYYVGDWRPFDVESIHQVTMSLNGCLRWLESHFYMLLIASFSKETLHRDDIKDLIQLILKIRIEDCEPAKEFTLRQQQLLEGYLQKVLHVDGGIKSTYEEFVEAVDRSGNANFGNFVRSLEALTSSDLFDKSGKLVEDRPLLFFHLQKIFKQLNQAFREFRLYVDSLEVAFKVKRDVFGLLPQYLTSRTDVEEILTKMGTYPYLTVNVSGAHDKQIPVGIISATTMKKKILGTTTLRDFCNREETKVPSYLEVISVIDHHKSSLSTFSPPTAMICDAQSANTIVAELAFKLHDEYSLAGMTKESIEKQIDELKKTTLTLSSSRRLRRLLKKREILLQNHEFYIHPRREYLEYLHYLYAILDDTDLLTKVSKKDVESVAGILNRMKTITEQKEVETAVFDELARDETFVSRAAQLLLRNEDLYSLYRRVYKAKENMVEDQLIKCASGEVSNVFIDTKIQNGCCRVGQTKVFKRNIQQLQKQLESIRAFWLKNSKEICLASPQIDLYLHAISTIASSEELHQGEQFHYDHQDQMWIWIPGQDLSVEHLKLFLNAFKSSLQLSQDSTLRLEFYGPKAEELSSIFKESFLALPSDMKPSTVDSFAVLYYRAGLLNSRKAMISPYLPKINTV